MPLPLLDRDAVDQERAGVRCIFRIDSMRFAHQGPCKGPSRTGPG